MIPGVKVSKMRRKTMMDSVTMPILNRISTIQASMTTKRMAMLVATMEKIVRSASSSLAMTLRPTDDWRPGLERRTNGHNRHQLPLVAETLSAKQNLPPSLPNKKRLPHHKTIKLIQPRPPQFLLNTTTTIM